MKVANLTRGTSIVEDAREATTFVERLRGLMGRERMPHASGLILYDNWVHTFWMRFPLDLIYFDKLRRVVGMQVALRPNRIGKPFWSANGVIELNSGVIAASRTEVGDQLRFE